MSATCPRTLPSWLPNSILNQVSFIHSHNCFWCFFFSLCEANWGIRRSNGHTCPWPHCHYLQSVEPMGLGRRFVIIFIHKLNDFMSYPLFSKLSPYSLINQFYHLSPFPQELCFLLTMEAFSCMHLDQANTYTLNSIPLASSEALLQC